MQLRKTVLTQGNSVCTCADEVGSSTDPGAVPSLDPGLLAGVAVFVFVIVLVLAAACIAVLFIWWR